jgi:hypothetical protein
MFMSMTGTAESPATNKQSGAAAASSNSARKRRRASRGRGYQIVFDEEQERLVTAAAVFAGTGSPEEYIISTVVEKATQDRAAYQTMSSQPGSSRSRHKAE